MDMKEYNRQRRQRLKAAGLCVVCGREPLVTTALGQRCREKHRAYGRSYKRPPAVKGMCSHCRSRPVANGRHVCTRCLEKQRIRQERVIAARRERGVCIACGSPERETQTLCGSCAEKLRQRSTPYRLAPILDEDAFADLAAVGGLLLEHDGLRWALPKRVPWATEIVLALILVLCSHSFTP